MQVLLIVSLLCGLLSASPTGKLVQHLGDTPLYHGGFFQGDMAGYFPDEDRHAIVDANKLWPGGVLYYELDSSVENIRDYILDGMKEYEEKTCITFREKDENTKDYVKIYWWNGCWSMVGRMGGEQSMSLGTGCHWRGLVVHELGHALGFYHEQQRADRDDYIEIIWENIMEGMAEWFVPMKSWESNLLGENFDYDSVMLYEETAFSKDGVAITIKPKTPGVSLIPVWKKHGLSESDVRRVNRLYQCFGNIRPPPPDAPPFECDFEKDDCGIVNQENMGSYFNRRVATVGGRTSTMLIMQDIDVVQGIGGRLITPHFQNLGRSHACLSFDYYLEGSIHEFDVTLQSDSTFSVGKFKPTGRWETFKRDIPYEENDPRMFITGVHNGKDTGFTFAVDNVKFNLEACK